MALLKSHAEAIDAKAGNTLDELADAGGASDDFKSKAKVIFESALNQKLQIEVDSIWRKNSLHGFEARDHRHR